MIVECKDISEFINQDISKEWQNFIKINIKNTEAQIKQIGNNYGINICEKIKKDVNYRETYKSIVVAIVSKNYEDMLNSSDSDFTDYENYSERQGDFQLSFSRKSQNKIYIPDNYLKMLGITTTKYGRIHI